MASQASRRCSPALALIQPLLVLLLLLPGFTAFVAPPNPTSCVAWRATYLCSPFGPVNPGAARPCGERILDGAGYCECEGGWTTQRRACGAPGGGFTCAAACAALGQDALRLPPPFTCKGVQPFPPAPTCPSAHCRRTELARGLDARLGALWTHVRNAADVATRRPVRAPGVRTHTADWVREGRAMARADVRDARAQWQDFLSNALPYPEAEFAGRGVVMLAGGPLYSVPALVALHMLRAAGCTLPVDAFFPAGEFPSRELELRLARLGAASRRLPAAAVAEGADAYSYKVAALLLSQYEEVLFLDADIVTVADPAPLFEDAGYAATGALLWPDFWESTAAPQLAEVLGLAAGALPAGSHESGQLVVDKRRSWRALLLAAFMNLRHELYYELTSAYLGKGDKETLPCAMLAVGQQYALVPRPVGAVGARALQCDAWRPGACEAVVAGNTMAQHAPGGALMFLHTNMPPKLSLFVPASFADFNRRWRTYWPAGVGLEAAAAAAGRDWEREVHGLLVRLRCAPWLAPLRAQMNETAAFHIARVLPGELGRFHAGVEGIDFRSAFRWGLRGPFLTFTAVTRADARAARNKRWFQRKWFWG